MVDQKCTSIENGLDHDVCFGTIDSWIIYNLTGKFLTDVTNASRTLMFDIYDLDWSQGILKELGIPIDSLPKVMPSLSNFGDINTVSYTHQTLPTMELV